jgi:glycosyltransferase involved in cell wall biosynthesis
MTYNIVIQDNPFQEEWIRKYNIPQKKIRLLKIGIKKQIFEPENLTKEISKEFGLSRKFVITFTGRFEEYKGLQHLIEAINKLKYKIKAIRLIAMGYKGNYLNKLKELITEYSLEKHVQIVENPDDETKLNILELSQIFVFPSQWEAFGISQVEAMAKGNAIISSNTEGGKYLIELEKNGYLFEYSDSEAIANYIEKLYKDKILLETIRKNNIEKAKDFVWETIVKDYQKILYETK